MSYILLNISMVFNLISNSIINYSYWRFGDNYRTAQVKHLVMYTICIILEYKLRNIKYNHIFN